MPRKKPKGLLPGTLLRSLLPAAAVIGLVGALFFLYLLPLFRDSFAHRAGVRAERLAGTAHRLILSCRRRGQEGRLTPAQAREEAIDLLEILAGPGERLILADRDRGRLLLPATPPAGLPLDRILAGKGGTKRRLTLEEPDPRGERSELCLIEVPPWGWVVGALVSRQPERSMANTLLSVFLVTLVLVAILLFLMFCQSILVTEKKSAADDRVAKMSRLLEAIRQTRIPEQERVDRDRLLRQACATLTGSRSCSRAWIALLEPGGGRGASAQLGHEDRFPDLLPLLTQGEMPGMCGRALGEKGTLAAQDTTLECPDCPLAEDHGRDAALSVRLEHEGRVYGILNTTISPELAEEEDEKAIMAEIAGDLAFALSTLDERERGLQTHAALQETVSKYEQASAASPDGILLCRREEGTILEANRSFLDLVGRGEEEVVGRPLGELAIWRQPAEYERLRRVLATRGECNDFSVTLAASSGRSVPCLLSARRVRMAGEERVIMVLADLSEKKRMEERLQRSEVRYQNLFRSMLDGYALCEIILDEAGRPSDYLFLEVNKAFEKITGLAREKVVGRRVLQVLPRTESSWIESYGEVALTGRPLKFERYYQELDKHFEVVAFQHEERRFAISFRDVTAARRAEEERRRHQAQSLEIQRRESLSRLAGRMAHDFNNLLMGILGNLDLLLEKGGGDDSERPRLERIAQAAEKASALCRQLLAFSGRPGGDRRPLDLARLIREMRGLLEAAIARRGTLDLDLAEGLPPLDGDPAALRQLVTNLVQNSAVSLDPGGGTIRVALSRESLTRRELEACRGGVECEAGDYLLLAVEDDGRGMEEETLERVFDPFFTTEPGKHGLGLAAVLGTAQAQGGAVCLRSRPGEGTRVKVLLPLSKEEEATPPPRPAATPAAPEGAGEERPRRALLVDDDQEILAIAQGMLERLGYRVTCAGDGLEATQLFCREPKAYDLVLLDMTMPRMDGPEALDLMRRARPEVRVILSSGYPEESIMDDELRRRTAGFIQKPYKLEELRQVLG